MYSDSICAVCSGVGCALFCADVASFLPQPQSAHTSNATKMNCCFISAMSNQQRAPDIFRLTKPWASSRGIVIVRVVPRQSRQDGCGMAVPKVYVPFVVVPLRDQVARRHKPAVVDDARGAADIDAFDCLVGCLLLRQHDLVGRQL